MESLERLLVQFLLSENLHPFSVLYFVIKNEEFLKISFYLEEEIDELKEKLDYKYFADKSGWIEIRKTNTIILRGTIYSKFIKLATLWDSNG